MKQTLKARLWTPIGALERSALFPNWAHSPHPHSQVLCFKGVEEVEREHEQKITGHRNKPAFQANNRKKQFLIFCRSDIGS
jgi:hypothetical protein